MSDDDIIRLREAAQGAAAPGPWAYRISDGAWVVYCAIDKAMRVAEVYGDVDSPEVEADAAYIAAASPDVLIALLDRLEVAERERDALRAERDAMAALLREARDAITLAGYGSRMAPEVRDTLERIDIALAAKEQSN